MSRYLGTDLSSRNGELRQLVRIATSILLPNLQPDAMIIGGSRTDGAAVKTV
jgi:hypothetical protein